MAWVLKALYLIFLKNFLPIENNLFTVNGKFNQLWLIVSGFLHEIVLLTLLFDLFTADMWNNLEYMIVSNADETTIYSEIITTTDRVKGANSLNREFLRILTWCST